jgi:hypothetical protein
MNNEAIHLDWTLYKDALNEVLELQRSIDGTTFESIMEYDVAELETDAEFSYDYMDIRPVKGSNYYRLKMRDSDGFIDYSTTLHGYIHADGENEKLRLYPNPASGHITVSNLPATGNLRMYDASGRLLRSMDLIGSSTQVIPTDDLNNGMYSLLINSPVDSRSIQFVKQ